jgi:hypothetical protein
MRLEDFRQLVERLLKDVPASYLAGVVAVEVSPKTLPDPVRADVYTLGECIPLEWSGSGADLQSRIVLYHGSFTALARLAGGDFPWREEAWETLAHELRHHLEWRANSGALEAYDWAAGENFKRHEGQPFDPHFYRSGEAVAPGVYKVDDDVFLEGQTGELTWHGCRYRVTLPTARRAPFFVTLAGLADPPPGDAILVVQPPRALLDLLRRRAAPVQLRLIAERGDG